ncbi:MAG: inositol monophosphatase family protein [Pirellulales bacterium]
MADYITVCEDAARAGAAELVAWQGRWNVREKGPADLVTDADLASQEAIARVIRAVYPDHAFVGEEGPRTETTDDRPCWIVDPLDGTTNYVHGVPQFAVSVAVAHGGDVRAGVVLNPISGECYKAVRGKGAWKNGEPIRTSQVRELEKSLLAISFPPAVTPDAPEIRNFLAMVGQCQAIRRMGSAALNLCYLACGRFDGYWATSDHAWDVAAGALLVEEAGGHLTAPDGGPFDLWDAHLLAAANPEIHGRILEKLTG